MSKFNSYAKKVNEIAAEAFKDYRQAEAAFKKAEEQARKYPVRNGMVDADYAAKAARANADYLEAQNNLKQAKSRFIERENDIKNVRKELAAELESHYAADPAALDSNTLELLKAGILKPNEYSKLMKDAQASGNNTMVRVIARYAGDAADAAGKKYGESSEQARTLRALSYSANENNGSAQLQAFDLLGDVFHRATNNPGMIDHWDELTSNTIENF